MLEKIAYAAIEPQFLHAVLQQLPGLTFWKNLQTEYIGCNHHFAWLAGLPTCHAIHGITDSDLPWRSHAARYRRSDETAMAGKVVMSLDPLTLPDQSSLTVLCKKVPLRNQQQQVVGIVGQWQIVSEPNVAPGRKALSPQLFCAAPFDDDGLKRQFYGLTLREAECLFHLVRGRPATEIARRLYLSSRTIEHYIENIKNKFGCFDRAELISKAFNMGFNHYTPEDYLWE